MNLAYAQQQNGNLDAAAEQFNTVLKKAPDTAHALFGLGRIELQRGNTAEGKRLIERARQFDPSLPAK